MPGGALQLGKLRQPPSPRRGVVLRGAAAAYKFVTDISLDPSAAACILQVQTGTVLSSISKDTMICSVLRTPYPCDLVTV